MVDTYETYQEAKISNPNSEVYKLVGVNEFISCLDFGDVVRIQSRYLDALKCNPADHCMTVEQFLKAGHKFFEGDVVMSVNKVVVAVTSKMMADAMNTKSRSDVDSFILRASALEEKTRRFKVEYVKIEDVGFFELKDEFQGRIIYFNQSATSTPDYVSAMDIIELSHHYMQKNLYRRVETETSERDEFIEFIKTKFNNDKRFIDKTMAEALFDAGCRFKLVEGE